MGAQRPLGSVALLLAAAGLALAQTGADAKIDRELINTIINSENGTAPFFVVFGERTPLAAAYRIQNWAARGRFVVDSLQATANRSQNGVRGYLQAQGVAFTPFWIENKIYIPAGTLDLARVLARRPEVAALIPEWIFTIPALKTSGATIAAAGWNITQIRADQVWSGYNNKGTGMVVANIDTGVQYNHPALVNQYRGNDGGSFTHTGNFFDAASADPLYRCGGSPCDTHGHGTHTMGTMVGDDGGSNQIGVAPGAKWIACRACPTGSCPDSYLITCAQWIAAPGGDAARRPNVVNNSWGGGPGDAWYRTYVQNWVAAGIFPAFADGNSGPSCGTAGSPGDYPESFASGATDSTDNIADFSSRGPSAFGGIKPNVSAPGVSIRSSVPTNGYDSYTGTSMASPHTAGAVALLWAIQPGFKGNISGTESMLINTAAARSTTETCGGLGAGAVPNNTYGAGRIDAKAAVDAAAAGGLVNQPPTVTTVTPATDGQQFNCNEVVSFAGTASDSEDKDLTAGIHWSTLAAPDFGIGGMASKTFGCTELGNQIITAKVTDSGGLSAMDAVTVNIINPNEAPPAAPTSLTATVSGIGVDLRWIDNASNEDGFKVYRRQKTGKWTAWTLKATLGPNASSTTDPSVSKGTYQYRVDSYNRNGDSPSNIVQVKK
jgi:subtilisin family serine protease